MMGLAAAIEKTEPKANGFFAPLFPTSPFYSNKIDCRDQTASE
jgi:hypothetical protein